jgi:peptide deformylase
MRTLVKDQAVLRKPCQPVTLKKGLEIGRELFKFLRQWNRTHSHKQGIGLSAPQIGIPSQVCVLLVNKLELVLVNPQIVHESDVKVSVTEGCLSLPGVQVQTSRNMWVEVSADNLRENQVFGIDLRKVTGKPYEGMLLEGVCVQHEIDHVFGILITDRASN